jgi:superfamily II DNA or RNA helicase
MSNTVRVSKIDEVFLKVECPDDGLAKDLFDFFSFTVPNAKFMPSYRNKWWDGKVRLFSIKTRKIYIGLLPYIDEFCKERGYNFEGVEDVIGDKNRMSDEDIDFFINGDDLIPGLGLPFQPRDYQIDAFNTAVQYGRQLLLSPTASGKSLIIYMLCRWFEGEMSLPNFKSVIIVPTTSLVEQMTKDFEEYGYKEKVCKIYHGQEVFDAPITITTWQSFAKAPKEVLSSFDMVVGDEAHLFKADVLKGILEKMKKTAIRFGTTGTLDGSEVHRLQLEGLFGPVKKVISTKDLMEDGTIANLSIDCIILRHTKQKKGNYQEEMDYLVSNDSRNEFICNLVYSLKGNTLVLFQYVEKHGAVLHGKMFKRLDDKLHYVYGGTDVKIEKKSETIVEKSRR